MIPKRPTDDWAPHAYAVDLIEHEHAVAVRAMEALREIRHRSFEYDEPTQVDWDITEAALCEIEESGWKP